MQSFRTEIENPVVEKDIIELEKKIALFKDGKIDDEKFRSLRLARGIYGQRQPGVQMIRIKLPYGRVSSEQLHRISEVSDKYSTGRLHITTRQDIQIHYVKIDQTPELWAELEKDDVTIREACGNTVRNVTASEMAGIDPNEPFDVTPYADATFKYFLRNPISQEMGRKFKIAFSSSDEDTALAYLHDIGVIPKIKNIDGKEVRGFKVLLGGGLGSQPRHADAVYEFLPTDKLIPFIESVIRIFDRFGERAKRMKARMKFLVKDLGLDAFLSLVQEEEKSLPFKTYPIDHTAYESAQALPSNEIIQVDEPVELAYEQWKLTNIIPQKQEGFVAIGIKVKLGDFYTDKARLLADLVKNHANNEIRFTLRQNILIRDVRIEQIPFFYQELKKLGFVERGYNTLGDITACPGTDTCNLGIASSTGAAAILEEVIFKEYPKYLNNKDLTIKISGCMNACGQHNMASIGFQGMSIKAGKNVLPALQVLLGGGTLGDGTGRFADKVIKIPSKRGPQALRILLDDFESNAQEAEPFLAYYDRQGQMYFYEILKDIASIDDVVESDFIDWGNNDPYVKEIGVGECAGVIIDLVSTLLLEAREKIANAEESLQAKAWSDAIYHTYAGLVNTAKAILLAEGVSTNSHASILKQYDEVFTESGKIDLGASIEAITYQIKENEPSETFALSYFAQAQQVFDTISDYRAKEVQA
ncbi:HEPN domain-containing protein [Belliella kenyensis]|uniref:HEPN domain-containing protein n=1 Tax=Belliella kenyensis TaxID=1472724 RepID=A0ABV8EPC9_9BACT|nr:HEPN domain-containing protein [Belliella kenyensis]MCH7402515.1 HEPN domain-containing protein [Belliella kenyensis]MDN3603314.1 HEPN domain-containing protein [Belliella kenyensis]